VLSQGTTLISDRPEVVRADPSVLDAYLGGEGVEDGEPDLPAAAIAPDLEARVGSSPARPPAAQITAPDQAGGPPAVTTPLLTINGIVAGYGGGDILREVSFDVAAGGITCIVGPNGAGKSTLLATISGLLRPRLGEIRFEGERLRRTSRWARSPSVTARWSRSGSQP
jgi:ABC-type multidrug transport system fused ATPase/permease subunit